MARKAKKVQRAESTALTERVRLVIRSFALSHTEGFTSKEIALLQAYLQDKYRAAVSKKRLAELVRTEDRKVKTEAVLKEIDTILFSTGKRPPAFKLGSSFCKECGMFKSHRKECPFCGFHEMTI